MANANLRIRIEDPLPYSVADGTTIEKGAILTLTDPRTAIVSLAENPMIAGIAAREKVANDGRTEIACFMRGVFDIICSGNVNIGDPVAIYNQLTFVPAATSSGAAIIGHALEAGTSGDAVQIYVNIGGGGYQV